MIVLLALVFSLIIFALGQLNPTGIADLLANLFDRGNNSTQENALSELADSIRQHGILQPLSANSSKMLLSLFCKCCSR